MIYLPFIAHFAIMKLNSGKTIRFAFATGAIKKYATQRWTLVVRNGASMVMNAWMPLKKDKLTLGVMPEQLLYDPGDGFTSFLRELPGCIFRLY
jgi:hypothetical protein